MNFHVRLPSIALSLLLCSAASTSHASETTRLWLERANGSAPLAQVPDFRVLAQQALPAVVSLQVEQRVRSGGGPGGMPMPFGPGGPGGPGGADPFEYFHRFFGGEMPREYRNRGLGSGFIVDLREGLILTNNHVVEDAESIEVAVSQPDGTEKKFVAKLLGAAPEYDVALIKTTEPLGEGTVAYLGDSETAQIGDWVMAVGNPFGLSHSVSVGIISARERRDVVPSGRHGLYNFLQTDASINPGNSGGPLVNMRGEVIGINSAVNASGAGIGFAIPINMVKAMLPELKAKGHFSRSWLGIKIQPLTPELAQSYGLKQTRGALVAELVPHGPAAEAKIQEGDVILTFDGKELRSASDLPLFASMAGVGRQVPVRVFRAGHELTLQVKLAEFPSEQALARGSEPAQTEEMGMVIADLTPSIRQQLGLDDIKGAVIKEISDTGIAAHAGLRPGDVIVGVQSKRVTDAQSAIAQIRKVPKGGLLRLKLLRGGASIFLALRKPASPAAK